MCIRDRVGDGGIGKVGNLPEAMTLRAFCDRVKEAFCLPSIILYDKGEINRPISRVGILPGSGKGEIGLARALGAEVYVTGDMGHHPALDLSLIHIFWFSSHAFFASSKFFSVMR